MPNNKEILRSLNNKTLSIQSAKILSSYKDETDLYKQKLTKIRLETTQKLEKIQRLEEEGEKKAYIGETKQFLADTADLMRNFIKNIYEDAEREMATSSPCRWSLLGIGSIALKQVTPYSDIECAIIIDLDEKDNHKLAAYQDYFKKLAYVAHLKFIALAETPIAFDKYGVNLQHLMKKGVGFDLGGKTPLGRADKPYQLVQTVEGMLKYVKNENNSTEHIDKNLFSILEATCHIAGDIKLTSEYQERVKVFLLSTNPESGIRHCQERAFARLETGMLEIGYLTGNKAKKHEGNLELFAPKLIAESDSGKPIDAKMEIFRVIDRLIYDIAMYNGIIRTDLFESNMMLVDKFDVSSDTSRNIGLNIAYAIAYANILRFRTYDFYREQKDIICFVDHNQGLFVLPVKE